MKPIVPTPQVPNIAGAADLSRGAIAQRQISQQRGNGASGLTGRQMGVRAGQVLDAAHKARKVGNARPAGKRRDKAMRTANEALLTAATQVRIAAATPLDKGFLHHLTIQQIQQIEHEVQRLASGGDDEALALLAVDTKRRVTEERNRASRNEQEPTR